MNPAPILISFLIYTLSPTHKTFWLTFYLFIYFLIFCGCIRMEPHLINEPCIEGCSNYPKKIKNPYEITWDDKN